jgi:hypothetical protein
MKLEIIGKKIQNIVIQIFMVYFYLLNKNCLKIKA